MFDSRKKSVGWVAEIDGKSNENSLELLKNEARVFQKEQQTKDSLPYQKRKNQHQSSVAAIYNTQGLLKSDLE